MIRGRIRGIGGLQSVSWKINNIIMGEQRPTLTSKVSAYVLSTDSTIIELKLNNTDTDYQSIPTNDNNHNLNTT